MKKDIVPNIFEIEQGLVVAQRRSIFMDLMLISKINAYLELTSLLHY